MYATKCKRYVEINNTTKHLI